MAKTLKLRQVLFLLILLAGVIPLGISTAVLTGPTQDLLYTQEQTDLTRTAEALSRDMNRYLESSRHELQLLGGALMAAAGDRTPEEVLRSEPVAAFLQDFLRQHHDWPLLMLVDRSGQGPRFSSAELAPAVESQVAMAFSEAVDDGKVVYRFVDGAEGGEPSVVLAVPVDIEDGAPALILGGVLRSPRLFASLAEGGGASDSGDVFLIDRQGQLIWASTASEARRRALLDSELISSFIQRPMPLTEIFKVNIDGENQRMIAIVSPIEEPGWGVVVHRPESSAFSNVRRLMVTALVSSLILVVLALIVAYLASGWIGQPIQRLASTTHDIAEGDFTSRVDTQGLRFELADLARDFNAMGGTVEKYVRQLQRAAQANRELFIGSLRAFTAAIDAKDPYTRGHSERVASVSRAIARSLGLADDFQNRIWIAALLHDVGKIGVEDRILKKGGVLSPEEYEQMKAHTVIGAEIMTSIEQLREALPVIRWHHENWNGRGYPDGLRGEQIPLMARIVAVADTFDAITTNRPYQNAYTLDYAVETIKKLTGARFDAKVVTAFLSAVDRGEIQPARTAPVSAPADAAVASG
ncbi:MAG: HD domain-containing protein [Acidobacteria bacterium]|nr:HD domain-containing protein [Acidobacteriota bacterium]